jgi:hypothetical protein
MAHSAWQRIMASLHSALRISLCKSVASGGMRAGKQPGASRPPWSKHSGLALMTNARTAFAESGQSLLHPLPVTYIKGREIRTELLNDGKWIVCAEDNNGVIVVTRQAWNLELAPNEQVSPPFRRRLNRICRGAVPNPSLVPFPLGDRRG